ncbi:MAG: S8 family serine peptidase [Blastocatellia bacterium]
MTKLSRYLLSLALTLMPTFALRSAPAPTLVQDEPPQISENAQRQIEALLQEKANRTPEQQKIDTQLLYLYKQQRTNRVTEEVQSLVTDIPLDDQRRVLVDVRGLVTPEVLQKIEALRGEVVVSAPTDETIRARVPLSGLEDLASLAEVRFIEAALEPLLDKAPPTSASKAPAPFALGPGLRNPLPGRATDKQALQTRFAAALAKLNLPKSTRAAKDESAAVVTGPPISQGDAAHNAKTLRDVFGFDGTGIRIGVLSDSARYLAESQASKNLPPDVTILPGQGGSASSTGEGTAMMEIIYDLAPGAKLFFATASSGDAVFAANIRSLRFDYKCDIIVDDVFYFNESPFQDGIIAQAVNAVTADGGLYFASAGNAGNVNDGTGGAWEGDWFDGGTLSSLPTSSLYRVHSFGGRLISNRLRALGSAVKLQWADPVNGSTNDYDLFVLDSTLSTVKAASTGSQTGSQAPYEIVSTAGLSTGDRVVIARFGNAQPRALHLNTVRGQLAIATDGQTHGHASAADAFAVAAVPASVAQNGVFAGGYFNPVETFSSDGPRRVFFTPTGTPIVPGNFLFATNGGTLRQKPDIAAADGVSTSVPGFSSFFGTSAAAPHAAAVAALIKSFAPNLTAQQIRALLTSTAIDIGPLGWDRSAGIGLVTPLGSYLAFSPSPLLDLKAVDLVAEDGDGDAFVEPGEPGRLNLALFNSGNIPATNVKVKIAATTPGVTILNGESDYFQIADGKAGVNLSPLRIRLADTVTCGARLNLTATMTADKFPARTISFAVATGQAGSSRTFPYTGPVVTIPDANTTGVAIRVPISGLANAVSKVSFRINGDNCAVASGTGLQHTWVGDVTLRLISPSGTVVTLMSQPGGANNFGQNFCNTLLDDNASASIQNIGTTGPYSGTFRPASPLAAFNGEAPNGTWTLQAIDSVTGLTGVVRSFSLLISTYDCARNTTTTIEANAQAR